MQVTQRWWAMPECKMFQHGLTIGPSGAVRPCCAFDVSEKNINFFDNWKARHIGWSQASKTTWLHGCAECQASEDISGHSLRTTANQIIPEDAEGITYWDLKINNTCNLACRMCDGWSSSTWAKLVREHPALQSDSVPKLGQRWHRDIDKILPHMIDAKVVKFTGGEPFLIPQVETVIDYLIEHEISQVVDLMITSNGTVDFSSWIDKFKKFKSTNITISIDSIGKRFEYIRAGASWDQVSQNVVLMNQLLIGTNITLAVTALPQALNQGYIQEVADWCRQHKIEFMTSAPLLYPDYMRSSALDDPELKEKLIRRMRQLDAIHGTDYRDFINE